jgi:hypothetical protein
MEIQTIVPNQWFSSSEFSMTSSKEEEPIPSRKQKNSQENA